MKTLEEIQKRKLELKSLLEDETKEVNVDEISNELDQLEKEERELKISSENAMAIKEKEERKQIAESIQNNQIKGKVMKEEIMKEKKYTISDPEYRSAWAKKLLNYSEDKFTEEELRALGDAVTTTATQFVAAAAETNGINNGGLLIPTSVRTDILNLVSEQSPFYRDIRKLQIAGNVDLPYLHSADDAEWYTESTETKNEGMEFKSIKLTGFDLAKDIVVTWKLESMAPESFISFITEELSIKIGKALVNAIMYGDGSNKPKGAINGLSAIEGDDPIDTIVQTYKSLSNDARIGAKAYISTNVNIDIVGYKDANGNYPFLNGLSATKLLNIEVDPFLKDGDIIVGNPRNYVLNEVEQLSIARESTVKGRKTTYAAYSIVDAQPKPSCFAKGSYTTPAA